MRDDQDSVSKKLFTPWNSREHDVLYERKAGKAGNGSQRRKEKESGKSEWTYYSFYRQGRSFQDWLDQHYSHLRISVLQYPTFDGKPVPNEVLEKVASELSASLRRGQSVVLMDSGGVQRVGKVCKHVGARRD